ncbi:PIN domain-containing protein [Thermococcus sp. LS2]|uniref:PIN domain-containing protein n=1 Tax=Thermococcus sp. LS2 TaxID=1638260 RepID=UPI00143A735C|nr:PIN domain-containing protein [Thermococcus sp. LS2]
MLIEALKDENTYEAVTSTLALGEVYHVLYNEVLSLKMYRSGIPLTLWSKLRNKNDLTEDEKSIFWDTVRSYLNELKSFIAVVDDKVDDEIYPKLVLDYGLRPHDAILLTTAIKNRCEWFITNDSEIITLNKQKLKDKKRKKRKPPLSELFNITPDSPQNFLRETKEEIGRENPKATKIKKKIIANR